MTNAAQTPGTYGVLTSAVDPAMSDVQLFLVRVWRHLSQFRASVRGIGHDEPLLFDEPQQLADYLRAVSEAGPSESTGPAGDEPGRAIDRR